MKVIDPLGNELNFSDPPKRIVSLVPSQTELLWYLGLEEEVVGITKFCIHPEEWFRNKTRVGGTKMVNIEKVRALQPDLIIANKEENALPDIQQLQKEFPVYISDIYNFEDAFQMFRDLGNLTGKKKESQNLENQIKDDISGFPSFNGRVLYLIWANPYMAAGQNTFINAVLSSIGFENVLPEGSRYPELSKEDIEILNPDYIFLSSEPFPFKEKHFKDLEPLSGAKLKLVDGEIFSWYGSRMIEMKDYFNMLLTS